jgi:short-subunit dehydrogenase
MSYQESVRKFAADILQTETKIDVLILNAGIALSMIRYRSNWFSIYYLIYTSIDALFCFQAKMTLN